jgi:hypothetical protein
MTKGYIEIREIPENCVKCRLSHRTPDVWEELICGYNGLSVDDIECGKRRPDWCPIKEHNLWECAKEHKEELLRFHERQRSKDES